MKFVGGEKKKQRLVPDPGSELLHQWRSVAVSPCLCQCTFYIDHLRQEGRGPLGAGEYPPLRDGWLYSQQSAHPLSPTRYQGHWQICWMIWGKTKGGSSIPLTSRTTCMWPCARAAGCKKKFASTNGNVTRKTSRNTMSLVLAVCGGCRTLCWCRSNAGAASFFCSVLSSRRKRLPPYLPQWFESFFILLRVMWLALNTNSGKLLNADQSTIVVREMVNQQSLLNANYLSEMKPISGSLFSWLNHGRKTKLGNDSLMNWSLTQSSWKWIRFIKVGRSLVKRYNMSKPLLGPLSTKLLPGFGSCALKCTFIHNIKCLYDNLRYVQ